MNVGSFSEWTDARVELLRDRALVGFSASQIAQELPGFSRNAIIGKANRLGLVLHGVRSNGWIAAAQRAGLPRPPSAPRERTLKRSPAPQITPASLRPTEPGARKGRGVRQRSEKQGRLIERTLVVSSDQPIMRRLTIVDLGSHDCRWPLGDPASEDFAYCGSFANDGPYCPYHCGLAYNREQRPTRREGVKCRA